MLLQYCYRAVTVLLNCRAGHLRYFLICSILKMTFFAFFIKFIFWLGRFLNRSGSEIGTYRVIVLKKQVLSIFKNPKKYRKCPALCCSLGCQVGLFFNSWPKNFWQFIKQLPFLSLDLFNGWPFFQKII